MILSTSPSKNKEKMSLIMVCPYLGGARDSVVNNPVSWKVDRVLANQRLNLITGTEISCNVPKAWIIIEDLPPGRKGQWHS